MHANLEEAEAIVGPLDGVDGGNDAHLRALANWFLDKGVAVVAITAGGRGCFTAVTSDSGRLAASPTLRKQVAAWVGQEVRAPAFATAKDSDVNANGAGDAFISALVLAAAAWKDKLSLEDAVTFAALAALQRVDGKLRESEVKRNAAELMAVVTGGGDGLPPTLPLN